MKKYQCKCGEHPFSKLVVIDEQDHRQWFHVDDEGNIDPKPFKTDGWTTVIRCSLCDKVVTGWARADWKIVTMFEKFQHLIDSSEKAPMKKYNIAIDLNIYKMDTDTTFWIAATSQWQAKSCLMRQLKGQSYTDEEITKMLADNLTITELPCDNTIEYEGDNLTFEDIIDINRSQNSFEVPMCLAGSEY